MTTRHPGCRAIEPDLVAVATGEGTAGSAERVRAHVAACSACRGDFERYRALDVAVERLRRDEAGAGDSAEARARLEARLADLRRRLVRYTIVPSPLGNLLLARTEHGVALVEYLGDAATFAASRLARAGDVDASEDGVELARVHRELLEYLEGRRTRLDWPLDFRLARGDFDRLVLEATARLPYGAVTSYAHIAAAIGKPAAVRAVAQALRWNPLPLVVPCHRVIGSSGALVGYAGHRVELKQRLLAAEGVRMQHRDRDWRIARDRMYTRRREGSWYCLPSCGSLARHSLAQLTLFGSRASAESVGLRPCTVCRPDLHPLE